MIIGTGPADEECGPDTAGTFAGFGADVRVRLSADNGDAPEPVALPVCALLGGWVRGQVQPQASASVRVYRGDHDAATALSRGRDLRTEIDRLPEPTGVLVVADGANTLTPAAPGGHHPDNAAAQEALDDALAGGDVAELTRLPRQILGRVAFQVLAGLSEPGPRSARSCTGGALRGGLLRRHLAAVTVAVRPLAIIGPTGTGKSQLALDVAERVGAQIVNADAMQLYRGMDIGTAKLSVEERRGIPHHQLDVLDVTETATVARYQRAAAADIEAIAAAGAVPIIVGARCSTSSHCSTTGRFPPPIPRCAHAERRLAEVGVGSCTPSWPVATPPRRHRSCPPTPGARCARWKWWS